MTREAQIKRAVCSLLIFGEYTPFIEFAVVRGVSKEHASEYALLCAALAKVDEHLCPSGIGDSQIGKLQNRVTRGISKEHTSEYALLCAALAKIGEHPGPSGIDDSQISKLQNRVADISETLHPDLMCAFCCASPRGAYILFMRAVARDIAPKSASSRWFHYTRYIAQCIHPMTVVVESDQCIKYCENKGVLIARGKYDAYAYAAIMLGAHHAPIEQIMDLARAGDHGVANRALSAFCEAGVAPNEAGLLLDYQNFTAVGIPAARNDPMDTEPPQKNALMGAANPTRKWMAVPSGLKRTQSGPPIEPRTLKRTPCEFTPSQIERLKDSVLRYGEGLDLSGTPHDQDAKLAQIGLGGAMLFSPPIEMPRLSPFEYIPMGSVIEYIPWGSVIERVIDTATQWFFDQF